MFSGFWEVRLNGCGPSLEDWRPTDWENLQLGTTSRPSYVYPSEQDTPPAPIIVRNKFHLKLLIVKQQTSKLSANLSNAKEVFDLHIA